MRRIFSIILALFILIACLAAGIGSAGATGGGHEPPPSECEPTPAHTEYTDYRTESPGEGWYVVDHRTIVDKEAYDETVVVSEAYDETVVDKEAYDETVFDHWQRYSWTGGPHTSDDPPAFPSSDWQPNVQGDPHGIGHAGAYFRSHGNSGNGDWFYLEAVTKVVHHEAETHVVHHEAVTEVVHHEAVTHLVYQYAKDFPAIECPPPAEDTPVTPPTFESTGPTCDSPSTVTVPVTEHIATTLYGVPGQSETPITEAVTVTGDQVSQFWIGYVADEGYVLDGAGTTHVDGLVPALSGDDCTPPPPVDVCPNLDGPQSEVPDGYIYDDETGECVLIPEEPPVDVTIPLPRPTQHDRCGPNNAGWNLPDDSVWISWVLEDDGSLTAIANEGFVFSNGEYILFFGQPVDSGAKCQVGPPPTEKPETPDKGVGTPKTQAAPPTGEQVLPNTGGPTALLAALGLLAAAGGTLLVRRSRSTTR